MKVRWRTFPLHPETPDEGRELEDLFKASPEKIKTMVAGLKATAENLGLDFGERTKTYNSRLAQELGLWAEEQGKGDIFHNLAFRAYFANGENLADVKVLLKLAGKAGLPVTEAEEVLSKRTYREMVDQDWADSRFKGVNAVPTFIMGRHKLVGAQSYEALTELLDLYCVAQKQE